MMFWRAILYFMDVAITTLHVQLCVIYVCLCVHGREREIIDPYYGLVLSILEREVGG